MTGSFRTTDTQQNMEFIRRFGAVRATLITLPCAGHTMTTTFCMWLELLRLNLSYCGRRHRRSRCICFQEIKANPFYIPGFVLHAPLQLFQHWCWQEVIFSFTLYCFFLSRKGGNLFVVCGYWEKARRMCEANAMHEWEFVRDLWQFHVFGRM